jgi:hypothetical protein
MDNESIGLAIAKVYHTSCCSLNSLNLDHWISRFRLASDFEFSTSWSDKIDYIMLDEISPDKGTDRTADVASVVPASL